MENGKSLFAGFYCIRKLSNHMLSTSASLDDSAKGGGWLASDLVS